MFDRFARDGVGWDGDRTGPGSASLIGIGRTAREAVAEITAALA